MLSAGLHVAGGFLLAGLFGPEEPSRRMSMPMRTINVRVTLAAVADQPPGKVVFSGTERPSGPAEPLGKIDAPANAPAPVTYYPASQLDERPRFISQPALEGIDLPPQSSGSLVVQFWISESGGVDIVEVEQTDLPEAIASRLIEQRRELKFSPGLKNGVAVRSLVRYEIRVKTDAQANAKAAGRL